MFDYCLCRIIQITHQLLFLVIFNLKTFLIFVIIILNLLYRQIILYNPTVLKITNILFDLLIYTSLLIYNTIVLTIYFINILPNLKKDNNKWPSNQHFFKHLFDLFLRNFAISIPIKILKHLFNFFFFSPLVCIQFA